MALPPDWEKQQSLRIRPMTKKEYNSEGQKFVQTIAHAKRRENGSGQSQSSSAWARSIHNACVHARIIGGKYKESNE